MTLLDGKIDQHELIDFFGVLPTVDEDEVCEHYVVADKYVTLRSAFCYDGIYLSISKHGREDTLFSTQFDGDFKLDRISENNGYDCLELTIPHLDNEWNADWHNIFKIKIFITPNIRVELTR